jgi:hypothetical protein
MPTFLNILHVSKSTAISNRAGLFFAALLRLAVDTADRLTIITITMAAAIAVLFMVWYVISGYEESACMEEWRMDVYYSFCDKRDDFKAWRVALLGLAR